MSDRRQKSQTADLIDHLLGELPESRRESHERELLEDSTFGHERDEIASLITQLRTLRSCPNETPDVASPVLQQLSAEKYRSRFWGHLVFTPFRIGSSITALACLVLLVYLPSRHLGGTSTKPSGGYRAVARYNDDRVAESADVTLSYINGAFGALVMIGFGVTSIILALVAIQAPTRRRGWVSASIVCALLAIGSFVLRSLVNSWFNTTTLGY